jgi:hypothetical protein
MPEVINTAKYNPVDYLKTYINLILPPNSQINAINFQGYVNRAFHSVDRPSGLVIVDYTSQKHTKEKFYFFIKHHRNACGIFNKMSQIYEKLKELGQASHMPRPYLCDMNHDTIYMQYLKGTDLKYTALGYLALSRGMKLSNMFYNIGIWLHSFHDIVSTGTSVELGEIKDSIERKLESTAFFTETEKRQIRQKLAEKISAVPDTFSLVRPHNDFALRNIMLVKQDDFVVIDWDAMLHPKFAKMAPIWNDITTFVISILSFSRFSPLISRRDVQKLADSFLSGYFEGVTGNLDKASYKVCLYIFTLCYYLGIIGDRSLPEIYKGKIQIIYLESLKKNLLQGKVY